MESKFQTSFIPKSSIEDNGKIKMASSHSLFLIISSVIVILTLVASGGLFAYQNILQSQINNKKNALAAEDKSVDYSSIRPILRLDQKMKLATTLLDNHLAISSLFRALQSSTLQNLRFTDFSFSYLSKDKIALSMKGKAQTFEAVAKQADAFSTIPQISKNFQNTIFSDLALDDKGNVNFSFITSINPALISYRATLGTKAATTSISASIPATIISTTTSTTTIKK